MCSSIILFVILTVYTCGILSIKPGRTANIKCYQYSRFVSQTSCGIPTATSLIIGGVRASEREYPHMALIGFMKPNGTIGSLKWGCGGSLISMDFILTAGHCTYEASIGNASKVMLGGVRMDDPGPNSKTYDVVDIIPHPRYSCSSKYYDIALLKLNESIVPTVYIRPACINTIFVQGWLKAVATGFGTLDPDVQEMSKFLMKVKLSSISQEICKSTYTDPFEFPYGIINSQFCAGELAGKRDTCQGDSGGPLQIVLKKPFCMYKIVGVTSFGSVCGSPNSPGVYTHIPYFLPWIEKLVWGV